MKMVGEYKLFKLLGKGSFGEVYLTQKGNNPQILATKSLDKKQTDRPSVKKYFDNEISIMKELNHPNIVKFYDMLQSLSHYYVIMEYCNGGSLSSCLRKYKQLYNNPFTQQIVQFLMKQILDGLIYIHSRKIIHRDIKLDNILVTFSNDIDKKNLNMLASQVKIIDFGLATRLGPENLTFTALGSPINMDPIILKKYNKAGGYEKLQGYNEKADIWSLGTICYEMLTGEAIFKVKNIKELMNKVEKGNYAIPINNNFSKEAVSFLNSMLQYDADDRLSANELAQHDFIVKNVSEFTPVDLSKISNKIDKNGLNINVKQNQTIWDIFNKEGNPPEINPFKNNQNIQNNFYPNIKSDKTIKRNTIEQNYVFRNDIYNYNNNFNPYNYNNQYIKTDRNYHNHRVTEGNINANNYNKININRPLAYNNRLTESFISPEKNLAKRIENEIKKKEKREKERMEKERLEKIENRKKDLDKNENEIKGIEKEKILKYINGLLEEYKSANEYFKENDLKKQEEDSNKKYIEIKNIKEQFEQGYSIFLNYLPKPITPEYIYGCSSEERKNKFSEVLNKYINEKNELETKIKNLILKLKKLDPENYAKAKNTFMPKIESDKAKLDKLKKVIEGFKDRFQNEWAPPPEYIKELKGGQDEKVSNEESEYKLKIYIGKTDYKKDDLNLQIKLIIDENKVLSKDVKLKKIGDFDEEFIWSLSQNEWNNLDNFSFIIDYWYGEFQDRGGVKLNISKIKDEKELLFSFTIDLITQNETANINISIKSNISERKKSLDQGAKEVIIVKRIYSPFNGKSADTNEIPNIILKNQ